MQNKNYIYVSVFNFKIGVAVFCYFFYSSFLLPTSFFNSPQLIILASKIIFQYTMILVILGLSPFLRLLLYYNTQVLVRFSHRIRKSTMNLSDFVYFTLNMLSFVVRSSKQNSIFVLQHRISKLPRKFFFDFCFTPKQKSHIFKLIDVRIIYST